MTKARDLLSGLPGPSPLYPIERDSSGREWRWLNGPRATLLLPREGERHHYARLAWCNVKGRALRFHVNEIAGEELPFPAEQEAWLDLGCGEGPATVDVEVVGWEGVPQDSPDTRELSVCFVKCESYSLPQPIALPPQKILCSAPWTHLFVTEDGRFSPCCWASDSERPYLRDEAGRELRFVDEQSLEAAWNSPDLRAMRKETAAGKWPLACEKCKVAERSGLKSYRQWMNGRFPTDSISALSSAQENYRLEKNWEYVDLRLGNICNLRCRMCTPGFSAGLLEEFDSLQPEISREVRAQGNAYEWFRSPVVWDALAPYLPLVREFQIAGGEPFSKNALRFFMDELLRRGAASRVGVNLITNLTQLPEWIYEYFPKFRFLDMQVSMDGVDALQEYIRHPSRFAVFRQNLQRVDQDFEKLNFQRVVVHITVQAMNIWHLPEMICFVNGSFRRVQPFPNLGFLYDRQSQYSAACLPRELKEKIAERLEFGKPRRSFIPRMDLEGAAEFLRDLDSAIQYMLEIDDGEKLPELRRSIAEMDRLRGQALRNVAPELAQSLALPP